MGKIIEEEAGALLYEAIRRGSKLYHDNSGSSNRFYASYLRDKRAEMWESGVIDEAEAARLRLFVNQWSTRYQSTPGQLMVAMNSFLPRLNLLAHEDLLSVRLDSSVGGTNVAELIQTSFDGIARCGRQYESTGTAKILHIVNPVLLVMWDSAIKAAVGVPRHGDGSAYAGAFLPKMQRLAREAVEQCMVHRGIGELDAVRYLCPCGHSLAKVIDEYNCVKYVGGRGFELDAVVGRSQENH